MEDELTRIFQTTFDEIPEDVVEYLIASLDPKEIESVEDVYELVEPQVQMYYDDAVTDAQINRFTQKLFHHVSKPCNNENDLIKLTSSVAIDGTRRKDGGMIDTSRLAIPDRVAVDQKKLEKAKQQQENKKKKAEEKEKNKVTEDGNEIVLASVSQANNKESAANLSELNFEDFDISFGSVKLLLHASIQFNRGQRYGLVGRNGSGKSTFLRLVSHREFALNTTLKLAHVEQELPACSTTALDSVLESDTERQDLLDRAKTNPPDLADIYSQLEEIGADQAPVKAAQVLTGLGFTHEDQTKPISAFSGGWRMRLALAQALFGRPDVLLLDEPTNMLDLKAVLWLETYLTTQLSEKTITIIVSHDRNFLNTVCNNVVHLHSQRMDKYRGDYDVFEQTKEDRLKSLKKEYETQKAFREHIQVFITRFRFNANRAAQVQSKIKMLDKLPALVPIIEETPVEFSFPDPDESTGFAVQLDEACFQYPDGRVIFDKICCGVDFDDRVVIVGENGAGKTTLLKILLDQVKITDGVRHFNRRARIGHFAQHHIDQLGDLSQTPLEAMHIRFPDATSDTCRSALARFGMDSDIVTSRTLRQLSGGQKSRVAFAFIAFQKPSLLVFDEPTNHLDIETVAALAVALNKFKGGLVLVSHDERLIRNVCTKVWLCKDKKITVLEGGVDSYKKMLEREFADCGIRI